MGIFLQNLIMAKITPSALISEIRGKWNGSCFQMWKSAITVRRSPRPRKIISESRFNFKGTVSSLSGCFYSMTPDQRIAWRAYAALLPSQMSGYNSFMARGTALEIANHSALCVYFDAPIAYAPPISPAPIALCYYPKTAIYCIMWTNPNCASVYMQGMLSVQAMYSNEKSPKWRIFDTVPSTDLHMIFDASSFPADQMIRFTARSINMRGELSIKAEAKPPPPLPESVTLLYPTGGESLYTGSSCRIEWRSKSVDNIQIDYSINNGVDWILIKNSISALLGQYTWTIPVTESAACKVKITDTNDPTNYDESDSVFTIITKPWVTLTAPNGSEEWEEKTKHNITWNQHNAVNVILKYSSDNGLNYNTITTSTPAAAGTYEWTVPEDLSTQCLVKILIHENQTIYDVSDNTFTIKESALPASCVARWIFKTSGYDAGNSRFTDQSGNEHHCVNNNIIVGDEYSTFNGTTSYGRITDFLEVGAAGTKLSVAIWVHDESPTGKRFFSHYDYSNKTCWYLTTNSGGRFSAIVSETLALLNYKSYRCNLTSFENVWHLLGFTFNAGVLKLYRDGAEVTGSDLYKSIDLPVPSISDTPCDITAGCVLSNNSPSGLYGGKFSKAWLFDGVITEQDFLNLFNEGC